MSWWQFWRSARGAGAMQNPDIGMQQSRPGVARSDADIVVSDERAMMISTVFACTRILVQTGATMPLGFYSRSEQGRDPLPMDHYLVQLLKYRPNNFMTAKEFRAAMWACRVLWGNGYARIKWMGNRPVSLVPLKPEFMEVERTADGLKYIYSTTEGQKEYGQRDIFHLRGWSTDGIVGMSVLGYAREALGLSVSADRKAGRAINTNPSGVLELDTFPTDAQKKQIREQFGAGNATDNYRSDGGLMIVPGGMKYKGISLPPDDLQLLESRQFQVPEICRFFGVPAVMVDGNAGATSAWPASYEQQMLSFLTFTMKPYLEEWEDAVPNALLVGKEKQTSFIEHKVEGLLRTDSAGRSAYYSQMVQNGLMTRNEVRMKENLKPMDGADELTVQVNMTSLDDLERVTQGMEDAESNRQPT